MRTQKNFSFVLVVYILLSFISFSNILINKILPFSDSPNHIAEAFLFKELNNNPSNPLFNYYKFDLNYFTPNTLHIYLTSLFSDVELGNQLFYLSYLILLIYLSYEIFHRLRFNNYEWLLAVFILAFNYNLMWGFSGFTLGISFNLLSVLFMISYSKKFYLRYLLLILLMSLFNYYANVQIFLFHFELIILISLMTQFELKRKLYLLLTNMPVIIIFFLWTSSSKSFSESESTLGFLYNYYLTEYFTELPRRIYRLFWLDNYKLFEGNVGRIAAIIFTLPVFISFTVLLYKQLVKEKISVKNWFVNLKIGNQIVVIFLIASAINYMILPDRLPGQSFLYQRFSVFFFLSMIYYLGMNFYPLSGSKKFLLYSIVIIHSILWFFYFQQFNYKVFDFKKILSGKDYLYNKKLGYIVDEAGFRGHGIYNNFLNYHIIWNNGITPTEITNYRFRLVDLATTLPRKYVVNKNISSDELNKIFIDYENMDYVLVYGKWLEERKELPPEWNKLAEKGNWMLYRTKNIFAE